MLYDFIIVSERNGLDGQDVFDSKDEYDDILDLYNEMDSDSIMQNNIEQES